MKSRKHLSHRQLYAIERGIGARRSYSVIARDVGRHRTTVSRVARQDGSHGRGRPPASGWCRVRSFDAEASIAARGSRQVGRDTRTISDAVIVSVVGVMARIKSGSELALEEEELRGVSVSPSTVYRRIKRNDEEGGDWRSALPRKNRRYGRSRRGCGGKIRGRVSISERSACANNRSRFGHWEGDLVPGSGRAAVATLTERKSGKNIWVRVKDKRSRTVARAICRALRKHKALSITFDNGTEFARHEIIAGALGCKVFFADPRSSEQRGSNENANGLLRRFFGKNTDFSKVSNKELREAAETINNRATKIHRGLSRNAVYSRSYRAV